jgi:hypothetical protein
MTRTKNKTEREKMGKFGVVNYYGFLLDKQQQKKEQSCFRADLFSLSINKSVRRSKENLETKELPFIILEFPLHSPYFLQRAGNAFCDTALNKKE